MQTTRFALTALTAALATLLSGSALAQLQFLPGVKRHLPAQPDATRALAFGDVDRDGDLDLVCGNGWLMGQPNRLYLNTGKGWFIDAAAGRLPPDSHKTSTLALCDVDGDGDVDLVCGNHGEQNRLYLNDGNGRFHDLSLRLPMDSDPTRALAVGDVDGDGDVDLVWGNDGAQNRLYLNDGNGSFTDGTSTRMPLDKDPTQVITLGDVDGDGDPDLAIGNWGEQNKLYLNDGRGSFVDATATRMPVERHFTLVLTLGDVDGDGDLDLLSGNGWISAGQQNTLYLNDGAGRFTDDTVGRLPADSDRTFAIALADLDGDGDRDLVCGNGLPIYPFTGGRNRLYLNDGAGYFSDASATALPEDADDTSAVIVGDVDGDGDPDVACGNGGLYGQQNQRNRLYLNDGRGRFTDATASRVPVDNDSTAALAIGDVDGDGDADLVCGNSADVVAWHRLYLNDGRGRFLDGGRISVPPQSGPTHALALGDVDGDGDLDVLCGNRWYNRLYLNDGKGVLTDATATRMPVDRDPTRALALGDVDGDGALDVVCGNGDAGPRYLNRLYHNDGRGTFVDVTATHMPAILDTCFALALADVDGDGDPDLVVASNNDDLGSQNRLYLNDGSGAFVDATAARLPVDSDRTMALALGDVDGDGDVDLAWGNYGGQNRLYLNDGKGFFRDATATNFPADHDFTRSLALVDVDGDGDPDLVSASYVSIGSAAETRLYLNDGRGFFTDASAAMAPVDLGCTSSLAVGDVDGDGDPDLVFGNGGQNHLWLNLQRHLDAPYLAIVGREYRVDLYTRPAASIAFTLAVPFVASAVGKTPLPPLGTWGLDPASTVTLPLAVIPPTTGVTSMGWTIPNDAGLVGATIYSQALIIPDLAWSSARWRFTNVNADKILRL